MPDQLLQVPRIDFASKQSFFLQIVNAIQATVADRSFPPNSRFPSIPRMARHLGVSQKPVQQAYRYLVERKILVSRSGQGTRVHRNALHNIERLQQESGPPHRAPHTRVMPSCVGMLVPTVESSLHSAITRMIETRLHRYDTHVILGNYEEDMTRLKKYIRSLAARHDCERIILSPFRTDFSPSCTDLLKTMELKLLLLANRVSGLSCPCLTLDNETSGRDGARFLAAMGHRHVLFISGPKNNACAREREQGCLAGFRNAGTPQPVVARGDFFQDRAYQQTVKWFRNQRPFSAVYCVNSLTCVGVLKALNDLRIRVPEDVSVITFDDMDYPTATPMTVIRQPLSDMADMVVSVLRNEEPWEGKDTLFAPELIVRRSVAQVAAP